MDALFGYSGLVGSNIMKFKTFHKMYRSNNINDAKYLHFREVYFTSLPGTKWLANKYPKKDFSILTQCMDVISTITADKFVLISTIDVYDNVNSNSDENAQLTDKHLHHYGKHRLCFENFIKNRFKNHYIFRLPALFGDGLKKNVLYDLIHNHEVYKININTAFQWYNLDWLDKHFEICFKNNIRLCNLFTEPIETICIIELFSNNNYNYATDNNNPILYNIKTKYWNYFNKCDGYVCDRNKVLLSIKKFITKCIENNP